MQISSEQPNVKIKILLFKTTDWKFKRCMELVNIVLNSTIKIFDEHAQQRLQTYR
jgi:hypothetical protein